MHYPNLSKDKASRMIYDRESEEAIAARLASELGFPVYAGAPRDREAALIECLYRGYKTLGFDTDGDRSGAEMLSHMGLGGGNLDAFISLMDRSFVEHRKDYDEACDIG